jgi:tetratricopeptide (TPR) repeat protein
LAEAHAADGFLKMFQKWDWKNAENSLRRAVELDPNSATAHHWLGVYLSIRGRFNEARGEISRAIDLDPNTPLYHADLGQIYYFQRNLDFAAYHCKQALALDPNFYFANLYLRDIHLLLGNEKEATEFEIKSAITYGKPLDSITKTRKTLEREGFRSYWEEQLEQKLSEWNGNQVNFERRAGYRFQIARFYALLGDKASALRWLDEAISLNEGARPFRLAYLGVDPHFDALRDEPRFQAILRKMNLAD